jgi:hypothetical protein
MNTIRTDDYSARLTFLSVFALFVLVFSVTRGLVPLLTQSARLASPAYYTATSLGIGLSCYGIYEALFRNSNAIGVWPRRLLIANLLLHLYWMGPLIVLRPNMEVLTGLVYTGVLPFSIYAFTKIREKILVSALVLLTIVVAGFVIYDFIALNTLLIPDGASRAFERQLLLRPEFTGFSRTGILLRAGGLLSATNASGSLLPHDSGNMLAIFMTFWLAILFQPGSRKSLPALLAIAALIALLFTQSASNIIAGLVGVFFILAAHLGIASSTAVLVPFLAILAAAIIAIFGFIYYELDIDMLWGWAARFGSEGDWEGMTHFELVNPWLDLFTMLFGHGQTLNLTQLQIVEQGIIKILVEFGLVHWIVLMSLLIFPIVHFFSRGARMYRHRAVPYVAAILVGVLSLWHYSSVLRATNIFVFFALYAQALRILAYPQKVRQSAVSGNPSKIKEPIGENLVR